MEGPHFSHVLRDVGAFRASDSGGAITFGKQIEKLGWKVSVQIRCTRPTPRKRRDDETWGTFSFRLELVQPVQCGDFVGFRQRGIVEDGIAKIFDTCSQGENDLADVNDFCRSIAYRMHSE
jgi:hypothetical protein